MELKLKSLELHNFKGIKNLKIEFSDITTISGANATGKTTIFDAYSWLLWDKDSMNRKEFNIKPFDERGQEKHGIESTVIGVFEVDGQEFTLSKVYKEVWTKKRGQIKETFTGNTTDRYLNSAYKTQKEYSKIVEGFISEQEFNLLSNPMYFNATLVQKERRKILLNLIKDVKPSEVVAYLDDLKELDLEHYSIDELKAMAKASARKTNEEIQSLPIRIDELEKSKITEDFSELEAQKAQLQKQLEDVDNAISKSAESVDIITQKNNQIQEYMDKMRDLKKETDDLNETKQRELDREFEERRSQFESKKRELQRKVDDFKSESDALSNQIERIKKAINDKNSLLNELRAKWKEENDKHFDGSMVCPACQREFEEEKKEQILSDFNKHKSETLTKIQNQATEEKEAISKLEKEFLDLETKNKEKSEILSKIQEELKSVGEFNEIKTHHDMIQLPVEYFNLQRNIEILQDDLKKLANNDNSSLIQEKKELQNKLESVISKLSLSANNKFIDEKIQAYMQQEKELAKKYEEQQRKIWLCDEYTRIYTSLVQGKINNLFSTINFRLFDTQVNGELKEVCDAMVNGVPYADVNNAGKINAGLDVINSLGKYLGKSVPVFVDNAESVNKLLDIESQIVKLYVSKDKTLKVKGE